MGDTSVGKTVTLKRKRVSKKNKLAWRKHSRTKDIEEFLNEQRHEERFGINFSIAEDDKLFFVDKTSSEPRKKKVIQTKAEKKLAAKKKLEGIPKCFEVLQPHTAVPDPIKKRNRVRSKEERKNLIKKKIEANRRACGILTHKEKDAITNRKLYEIAKQSKPVEKEFTKDLWEEKTEESPINSQWLNKTTVYHVLKNTGKIRKKVPTTVIKAPSILPAIEAPHPGLSYNPSYADHQALLKQIVENENKLIKEEQHINRVTTNMFSRITRQEATDSWVKEILEDHPKSDGYIVKKEEENEKSEYKAVNPPAKDKKKTLKTRRNMRLAKAEEYQRKLKAIEKKKVADIYKLKKIVQNVEKTEQKELENQALQQKKKKLKELQTKQLSKVKFKDLEPEFNMPYDLSGNLREMKCEGNILVDRFKSLQKRNILEPSVVQRRKIVKRKIYTLSSHKESREIPVRKKSQRKK